MTLQYSLCCANLSIVEIMYLHLRHWRFIKPIIIVTNAALYIVIKIKQVGLYYFINQILRKRFIL